MTATQGTPARLQTKENGLYVASWRIHLCRILKDNEKSTQKEQVKSTRSASKPFSRLFGQTGWEKAKLLLKKKWRSLVVYISGSCFAVVVEICTLLATYDLPSVFGVAPRATLIVSEGCACMLSMYIINICIYTNHICLCT